MSVCKLLALWLKHHSRMYSVKSHPFLCYSIILWDVTSLLTYKHSYLYHLYLSKADVLKFKIYNTTKSHVAMVTSTVRNYGFYECWMLYVKGTACVCARYSGLSVVKLITSSHLSNIPHNTVWHDASMCHKHWALTAMTVCVTTSCVSVIRHLDTIIFNQWFKQSQFICLICLP